jgi:glycyl-tRNA synthetase (class II)
VREFTLAEIEHFVDPEDKSHPKFAVVADLDFLMFPRELQLSGDSAKLMKLRDAVSKVCILSLSLIFWWSISFFSFLVLVISCSSDVNLSFYLNAPYRELLITRHLVTSLEGYIFS